MMEFLIILASFLFGWRMAKAHSDHQDFKMLSDLIEEERSKVKEINMYIETMRGQIFAYEAETNTYLSHAENSDKLKSNLIEKYPNTRFILIKKENKILIDHEN